MTAAAGERSRVDGVGGGRGIGVEDELTPAFGTREQAKKRQVHDQSSLRATQRQCRCASDSKRSRVSIANPPASSSRTRRSSAYSPRASSRSRNGVHRRRQLRRDAGDAPQQGLGHGRRLGMHRRECETAARPQPALHARRRRESSSGDVLGEHANRVHEIERRRRELCVARSPCTSVTSPCTRSACTGRAASSSIAADASSAGELRTARARPEIAPGAAPEIERGESGRQSAYRSTAASRTRSTVRAAGRRAHRRGRDSAVHRRRVVRPRFITRTAPRARTKLDAGHRRRVIEESQQHLLHARVHFPVMRREAEVAAGAARLLEARHELLERRVRESGCGSRTRRGARSAARADRRSDRPCVAPVAARYRAHAPPVAPASCASHGRIDGRNDRNDPSRLRPAPLTAASPRFDSALCGGTNTEIGVSSVACR